ncbi:fatty acid synthase-like [Dermacentor andersoni]|uniref:fatty acid synthase-like n=1 Tax=Dermacentor andersoni TaxID=34620 RepID=UPI0024180394|nr:fatty acid synthase-like [Dermacentor andersoni]
MTKEDIIITGISGRYPQADSFSEFKEKLFGGVDLITDDEARWPRGFLGLPERMGTIKDLSRFDASFFGVPPKQVQVMDPQLRLLIECSYEAIVDAGYDPATLRGRKIGVFVGCGLSETWSVFGSDSATIDGYIVTGAALHMFSNRVSYCLDFCGPSLTIDTSSSSTMAALNLALQSLRCGECEAAIVGGSHITLNPLTTLSEFRFGMLARDGKSKTFNANADGYARSETIGAMFLQPASKALRFYAKLINIRGNADGYKVEGITVPSSRRQEELLREVYAGANVDPLKVTYVETHGTGTKTGDPQELAALSRFFCVPERKRPLKIGAVKSNAGHAETASSINTISKVIILMETGMIPPNLHFEDPNPIIPCLHDGSIEVISKLTPFDGGLVGINAFGFGGTNVHAILESNPGPQVDTVPREKPELPRLVLMAGRSEESLRVGVTRTQVLWSKTLDRLEADGPYPDSAYALLNRVGQPGVKQFPFRGYALIPVDGSQETVIKVVEKVLPAKRPLWFVFTGMGCQWNGMARQMMQFDVFARSIQTSHDLLARNFGLDLIDLVTSVEPRGPETVANVLVSITAIQVALVDVIYALGLRPDGIVGHSLGEIASGYADGGLTAEQAVLCAYWRGRCTDVGNLPRGAMAAVGLTWEEAKRRRRNGVEAACHNAEDCVTVSGPEDAIFDLVKELQQEKLFARVVNTMNVAFHSTQMRRVGAALLKEYKQVVLEPKPRGKNWVSSSVPESRWTEPIAQHCSAEYFVNNLVSPVLFCEALRHVPRDAIVVEIAPHCLLLSVLRRTLGSGASCVGLMKRGTDNHSFFLGSLGKLHTLGVQMDPSSLYPPVPWPVPRGTPNIGHLVSWDHTQQWAVASWKDVPSLVEGKDDIVSIDISGNEDEAYLAGHRLCGEATFPVGGHLVLAWKSLSRRRGKVIEEVPVIFEHVKLHKNVVLPDAGTLRLVVTIMYCSGEFEVCEEGGAVAASGSIRVAEGASSAIDTELPVTCAESTAYELDAEDIYKELAVRGYDYQGAFRGIMKADIQEPRGKLQWKENWVTFVDSMIQYIMFKSPVRVLRMPTSIEFCRFDPYVHAEVIKKAGDTGVEVICNNITDTCRAGGAVIRGLKTNTINSGADQQTPLVEEYRFVPYLDNKESKDNRESLTREYVEVCCNVARQALKNFCESNSFLGDALSAVRNVPEHVVSQYLNDFDKNHALLRFLNTIRKQEDCNDSSVAAYIKSALPAHKEDLENDVLNTALLEEDPLRFLLDTVVENTNPKKLRVLEFATQGSDCLLVSWVATYLSKFNLLPTIEYTVAHSSPERLSGKIPQGTTVVSLGSAASRKKLPEVDLIVTRSATWSSGETKNLADEVSSICRENGFVLLAQRTALTPAESLLGKVGGVEFQVAPADEVEAQFLKHGLRLVAFKSNNVSALYLFRKRSVPIEEAKQEIFQVNSKRSDLVDFVKKKVLDYEWKPQGENMWLLAEEAGASGIVGLTNCLRYESGGSHIRCVFDAGSTEMNAVADFEPGNPKYRHVVEKDLVMNVYRNGQWGSHRHVVAKSCNLENAESILGQEFSGTDQTGRRVMGLVSSQALATVVAADPDLLWEVPDAWTLTEASTVPLCYSTAYYALLVRGNMRPGESVLVQYGNGCVGQAAIAIALSMGCTVFATVGSSKERHFIKNRFPQLRDRHIVNYSSLCLEEHILQQTKDKGVDLVFDTLHSANSKAIAHCLTWNGRHLVIDAVGKTSHRPREELSQKSDVVNISAVLTDSLSLKGTRAAEDKRRLAVLLRGGIISGTVRPLPATVFPRSQVMDAFKLEASETNAGKVVLQVRPDKFQEAKDGTPPFTVEAIARTYFYRHKAYVIVGEVNSFALEFVDWMVSRGCRNLLLTASHGAFTAYQRLCLHRWETAGASVVFSEADVSTTRGALQIIKEAEAMGPIGGIFNVSVCHEDNWIADHATEVYQTDYKTKAEGMRNLDEHSRNLCPHLDHFVVFSSVCSGRGTSGRTLSGYVDSTLERLCDRRVADGFPGVAIQWGAIDEAGLAREAQNHQVAFEATQPQHIKSCFEVLEKFLNENHPVVSSLVKAEVTSSSEKKPDKNPLVDSVARILGFQDSSKVNYNTNLGELGLDSVMGVQALTVIEKHTGLALSVKGIRMLTLNGLREMSKEGVK